MPDIKVLVEGGKASAGAPLGPALGPLGVNIVEIVSAINEKTKAFSGMKVPVTISVDSGTKEFEIIVGSPPASSLIKKEAGIQKGSGKAKEEKVGNLSIEQLKRIAEMKIDSLNSSSLKKAANEIAGTCKQMGVTIEGKDPKEVIREINEGIYDSVFA